jgi:hypothetical protein
MTKIENRTNQLPINSESSEISSAYKPQIDTKTPSESYVNDQWELPRTAHGCPACPHPGIGPLVSEPPASLVNSRPAITMKDQKE